MNVASKTVEVGIRDLKNNLSRWLDQVRAGDEIVITDRGRPVARLSGIDRSTDRLTELIAQGLVEPPESETRSLPDTRVDAAGPVSDLVAEHRR